MRGLVLCWRVLLLPGLGGIAAEPPPAAPLSEQGAAAQAVHAALHALAQGDAAPLAALPADALDQPPGLPDPTDPTLIRRWPELLPTALAHLPPALRTQVTAAQPRLAMPLPPTAHAWERGDLLAVLADGDAAHRGPAARLLGWAEPAEPPLPDPGLPIPTQAREIAPPSLLAVAAGHLLGLDSQGRTRWQRRLEQGAQVITGGPWAVLRGRAGIAVVAGDGRLEPLPAVPAQAILRGVAGAGVWFAAGPAVWGFDPATGGRSSATLPAPPQGPPLGRGLASWWLTSDAVIAVRGPSITATRHGLHLSLTARLAWFASAAAAGRGRADGAREATPGLIDGERRWLLPDLASDLAAGDPLRQAEAQLAAGRAAEVPAPTPADPPPLAGVRLRAALASGRPVPELPFLAPQDAAVLALVRGTPPPPDVWLTDDDAPWLPVTAWWHRRRSGAEIPSGEAIRDPQGGWRLGPVTVTCTAESGLTTVTARRGDSELWSRRWPSPAYDQAPGRAFAVHHGTVVIAEGDHATVLALATGRRWAAVLAPGLDPDTCAALPTGLVAWPVGLGNVVRWIDPATGIRHEAPGSLSGPAGDGTHLTMHAAGGIIAIP